MSSRKKGSFSMKENLSTSSSISKIEMLSVSEASQIARVSASTIRNWIQDGHLVAVRYVGRLIRIRRSDLEDFIARSMTGEKSN
jgi:excisionase family DNA binding protein